MFPVTWERHASLKVSSEITTSYTDSLHMYTDMLILSDKNFPSNQPAPDDDTHCGLVHACASCLIKEGVWVGWFKSPSESRTDGAFSCFHRDIIKAVKRVFSPLFFCIFQMVGLLLRFPTKTEDVSQLQISAAAIFRSSAELILLSEKLSRIPARGSRHSVGAHRRVVGASGVGFVGVCRKNFYHPACDTTQTHGDNFERMHRPQP